MNNLWAARKCFYFIHCDTRVLAGLSAGGFPIVRVDTFQMNYGIDWLRENAGEL